MASFSQSRPAQGIQARRGQEERFYLGVQSTGHVCRPTCPAVKRSAHRVQRYNTLEEARSAGLWPCGRCTPDRVTRPQFALAQAKVMLDDQTPTPDLKSLARAVDMDRSHFQRVFRAAFGLSPKQYALQLRAARFKAVLRASPSVTLAMYEAGHNTPRTLYDRATDQLGMKPLEYRDGGAGVTLSYAFANLPGGRVLVAATERGVCALYLSDGQQDEDLLARLRDEFPRAWFMANERALSVYVAALRRPALEGRPLPQVGLAFHERVWAVLGRFSGTAPTYAELARRLGLPSAEEAVAAACEVPPIILLWPRMAEQGRKPDTGTVMRLAA